QRKAAALKDDDLWTVGELEKEIATVRHGPQPDALEAIVDELQGTIAGETVARFDAILDQLVLRVPERERAALFPTDDEARGLTPWEQRGQVATRAVDALIAKARSEEHTSELQS